MPVAGPAAALSLKPRGGRTLPALSFKTFYYGAAWRQDPASPFVNPHAVARAKIDPAIEAAMQDAGLNAVLAQYFPGKPVKATALPSEILDNDPRGLNVNIPFDERDVRRVIGSLSKTRLAGVDLATTAINIVLPQGMTVAVSGLDGKERPPSAPVMAGVPADRPNRSTGIAGYHGTVTVTKPAGPVEILYSVVVWSDGSTGIPVPGWEGWENIVATLYHELQEIRTNPDVDCAIRTGQNGFIGLNTDPLPGPDGLDCREIGDLPLILAHDRPHSAFARIPIVTPAGVAMTVPIQRMWCNIDGRPKPDLASP